MRMSVVQATLLASLANTRVRAEGAAASPSKVFAPATEPSDRCSRPPST
jgi:hypothetical protein